MPGAVSAGYTDDVLWLLLDVRRGADAPDDWVLRFSNAVLDSVRLYRLDGEGHWSLQEAGAAIARDDWPVDARQVSFRCASMRARPNAGSCACTARNPCRPS